MVGGCSASPWPERLLNHLGLRRQGGGGGEEPGVCINNKGTNGGEDGRVSILLRIAAALEM